ncbi:hypothetical protein MCACP_01590 [Neomoorella carbonis]
MSLALKEIAVSKDKVYTYDDYCRLPEGAPYQLIGGNWYSHSDIFLVRLQGDNITVR